MENANKSFDKLEIPVALKLVCRYESARKVVSSFPKHERYALGERIENSILEATELVIIANNSSKYEKERILIKANAKAEILKILYRLAFVCGFIDQRKYLDEEKSLQEIGKMLQGWIKFVRYQP